MDCLRFQNAGQTFFFFLLGDSVSGSATFVRFRGRSRRLIDDSSAATSAGRVDSSYQPESLDDGLFDDVFAVDLLLSSFEPSDEESSTRSSSRNVLSKLVSFTTKSSHL